jgi:hypothetical protein
MHVQVATDVKK